MCGNQASLAEHLLLLALLSGDGSSTLGELVLGAETHDTTAPLLKRVLVVVELGAADVLESGELGAVLCVNLSEGKAGGVALVHESSKAALVVHDAVGDVHLAAESGHPDDELEGGDISSDDDELGLLLLNEGGHVVETELDHGARLGGGLSVSSGLLLSGGLKTVLLLLLGLRAVRGEHLEELNSVVLLEGVVELSDARGDLKTLHEDGALALEAHVRGPLDIAAEIALGREDVLADAEGLRPLGEERVLLGHLAALLRLLASHHCAERYAAAAAASAAAASSASATAILLLCRTDRLLLRPISTH